MEISLTHREMKRARYLLVLKILVDGKSSSFGVQGIENGLDNNEIGPALHQTRGLLIVGFDQLIESNVSLGGILDIRRNRGCSVGRPDRTSYESRFGWLFCANFIAYLLSNFGGLEVKLIR